MTCIAKQSRKYYIINFMNIYITREIPDNGIQMLKDAGHNVTVSPESRPLTKAELIAEFSQNKYEAVLSLLTDEIDSEVIDSMEGVKVIAQYAVGYNNIDVDYAKSKGIKVCNVPTSAGELVAEHTLALMFALTSRISWADNFVKTGRFKGWDPMLLRGETLYRKTLGIVGTGDIGAHVALLCGKGLGMRIVYFDIKRNESLEEICGAEFLGSLDEVMEQSDVLSLHVPLNDHTHHMIHADNLKLMKSTAIIINTARGAVIDEAALVKALESKQIAGAGLDVFENEPSLAPGLANLQNVILTPHIASATKENREEMSRVSAENIITVLKGEKSGNIVN